VKKLVSALSLALSLAVVSCGGSSGPVGSWELDSDATAAAVEAAMEKSMEGKSEAEKAMAKGMMGPMLEMIKKMTITMEIKDDNTFVGHADNPDGTHEDKDGTWKVDGDKITLTPTPPTEGKTEPPLVGTIAGSKITATSNEGGMDITMVFNKK